MNSLVNIFIEAIAERNVFAEFEEGQNNWTYC